MSESLQAVLALVAYLLGIGFITCVVLLLIAVDLERSEQQDMSDADGRPSDIW